MNKAKIEKNIYCFLTMLNPNWNIKLRYRAIFKKPFPMKNPKTFNEKLLWLRMKYYNDSKLVTQCADKVAVRDYVIENGYGELLNNVYGVYDSVEQVPWDNLPQQFAMKWNFGATFNIICDDVGKLDIEEAKKKMEKWGKTQYYLPYAEMQYKHCKKQIIIEKYLDANRGFLPYDYKLYCFDGKCKAILFIADRDAKKKGGFYSNEWEYLGKAGAGYQEFTNHPERPCSLETMIACAEKLSEGIPFVRVDFYDFNGRAIFGEMTFTPAAGLSPSQIKLDGKDMGEYIDLTKKGKIII